MNLPQARRDDLLATRLDDEVVVYDPERKRAHSLNRLAAAVWNHADGTRTIEELQRLASHEVGVSIDQAAVMLAVRKLQRAHLLMENIGAGKPLTRREMLGRAGRYSTAALVTPLVASSLVPAPVAAASACGADQACAPPEPGFTFPCSCKNTIVPPGSPPKMACLNTQIDNGFCNNNSDCVPGSFCWDTKSPLQLICSPTCPDTICPCH
jgi:Coenzyme PQQ synthesis protein D (PqqD)